MIAVGGEGHSGGVRRSDRGDRILVGQVSGVSQSGEPVDGEGQVDVTARTPEDLVRWAALDVAVTRTWARPLEVGRPGRPTVFAAPRLDQDDQFCK